MIKMKELLIEFKLKRANIVHQDELIPLKNKFLDLTNKLYLTQETFIAMYLSLTRFDSQRVF